MSKVGAMQNARAFDEKAQYVLNGVKHAVEVNQNTIFSKFEGKLYATQVVAGTNYFMKVNVGNQHLHIRAWHRLDNSVELSDIQTNKSADDPILYF